MIPRSLLQALVIGLILLVVLFAVLMGFQALVAALGDAAAARVLQWIAMACLVTLAVDVILLLAALGIRASEDRDDGEIE